MAKSKSIKTVNNSPSEVEEIEEERTVVINLGTNMCFQIYLKYESTPTGVKYIEAIQVENSNGNIYGTYTELQKA